MIAGRPQPAPNTILAGVLPPVSHFRQLPRRDRGKPMPQATMSLKALREQLRKPAATLTRIRNKLVEDNAGKPTKEWRDFTAEEKAEWDEASAELDTLNRQ